MQISPIKINPWSAVARALGKALNRDILEKIDTVEKEIESVKDDVLSVKGKLSEQRAVDCRARILRFGDEVRHGTKHSKEHFDQILRDIDSYEIYCAAHPQFENNVTEASTRRIKSVYAQCLAKNDFL